MSDTIKKLSALLGAGVLSLAMFGTALAATGPSDQGVTPTLHAGNITANGEGGSDQADCDADDAISTGSSGGSDTSENGVTVTWTYDATTKEFGFTATGGIVTIAYIKGSDAYNQYDYSGLANGGGASDGGMFAPDNSSEGPAGLSHATFCTGEAQAATDQPSFEATDEGLTDPTQPNTAGFAGDGTSGPADGAWLLVIALGALLASVVVMTPARATGRR